MEIQNNPSILEAVKSENINAVKEALTNNTNLELKDEAGNTALHIASQTGNEDIINLLLERGTDVKANNKLLDTPLHIACQYGNANIVSIFLKKDVLLINTKNRFGNTPLHIASKNCKANIVKILLEQKADFTIKNRVNETAYKLCYSEDVIQTFIEVTPDALSEEQKETLLDKASKMNWLTIIDKLLKLEVNIDLIYNNKTALMVAVENGHNCIIKKLLKSGADINVGIKYLNFYKTALHLACENGNLEAVKLFIEYKANIGRNHISFAIIKDSYEIVEYLIKNGYTIKADEEYPLLHECCFRNSFRIAEMFLNRGATIDAVDAEQVTILSKACYWNAEEIVNVLLKKGANVNSKCNQLKSPLHWICCSSKSNVNIVKLLLSYNADAMCKDIDNKTALDYARENKHEEIVNILENVSTK